MVSSTSGLSLSLCLDPNLIPALRRLKLPSEHSEEVVSVGDSEGVVNVVLELFEVSRLEGDNSSDSDI